MPANLRCEDYGSRLRSSVAEASGLLETYPHTRMVGHARWRPTGSTQNLSLSPDIAQVLVGLVRREEPQQSYEAFVSTSGVRSSLSAPECRGIKCAPGGLR